MSALDAWKFAWGKVLGSTIYTWYGAGICLLAAAWGMSGRLGGETIVLILGTNVAGLILLAPHHVDHSS